MTLVQYSKCRIEFWPTRTTRFPRDSLNKCIIEIRQDPNDEYSLRAADAQNNKNEIFKFQFVSSDLYRSGADYDEISCDDGTYRLFLEKETRKKFYEDLDRIKQELSLIDRNPSSGHSKDNRRTDMSNIPAEIRDEDNILIRIRKLEECLKDGNSNEAQNLARDLARAKVQLKARSDSSDFNEKMIQIRVKVDDINTQIPTDSEPCTLNVYSSTTIQDLQQLFHHTCKLPVADQYFFVNGFLAYEKSSMEELKINDDALFVLCVIPDSEYGSTKL